MRAHAELIKQWAEDEALEVEVLDISGRWTACFPPTFSPSHKYRIKPKEKKKVEAQSAAQLAELTAISEALGTNEGHSSVSHILALQAKVAELEAQVEKWTQIAEYQYAKRMYPGNLELGQGALDAWAKNWTTYKTALASPPDRKPDEPNGGAK